MKTPVLLLLLSLCISSPAASVRADDASKITMPPFSLTEAEETDARIFAERILREQYLPRAARSPESYQVQGIDLSESHLGYPFLDVTLRGRSIDDYRNSTEEDPRLFPGVLYYCFPVFVAGRKDAVVSIILVRNQDENRHPFPVYVEEGPAREQQYPPEEFILFGYYFGGQESRAADAVRLRAQYGRRISFVSFLDTGLRSYIMVDDSTGVLCGVMGDTHGVMGDTPTSIHERAAEIKRMLQ
jgi:hypothetical protein